MRLLADENLRRAIVHGVLLRNPEADFLRAQDAGLSGLPDPKVLAWAADKERIVVTQDFSTFPDFAYERVAAGLPMPGVFVIHNRLPISAAIEDLLILISCSEPNEWEHRVRYLPL